jgi:hypothetical protein
MSELITFYRYSSLHSTNIPIIQRDYAQGRQGQKEKQLIRRFLLALEESLNTEKPLSLNFIYGMEKNEGDFLPIDGQQRLTTLFLLHWFTALKCEKLDIFLKSTKKFTYQTRNAAIDFFEAIQPADDDNGRLEDFYSMENASAMKDFNWFNLEWIYDPTVESAVEVLNQMYALYGKENFESWWNLLSGGSCPITFLYVPINKTSGADEESDFENESRAASTYIKMNARGKHLSDFENVKALIHRTGEEGEKFAHSNDTNYIKIIERLAEKDKNTGNSLSALSRLMDDMMMRLLINVYNDLYLFTCENSEDSVLKDDYFQYSEMIRGYAESGQAGYPAFAESYFQVIDCIFNTPWKEEQNTLFSGYCKNDGRPARLRFAVLFFYVWKCNYNDSALKEWRHVLDNFHIDSDENTYVIERYGKTMFGLFVLIQKMNGADSPLPLDYLAETPKFDALETVPFVKPLDWKEEHIKAKIIREHDAAYNYFDGTEKRFDRRIRIFLYLAGFWDGAGDKRKLDVYTDLAEKFELRYNEDPPMELIKLFYLFATGFEGSVPIAERPFLEKSLFCWDKDGRIERSKLGTLRETFDYLAKNELFSREVLSAHLDGIARKLYEKKDWRAFALTRDEEILFNHLRGELLIVNNNTKVLIFNLVKKLDLAGKDLSGTIRYSRTKKHGEIGENEISRRRIRLENKINGIVSIILPDAEDYTFYTEEGNIFTIYRYSAFDGAEHQFEGREFSRDGIIDKYNDDITLKLKEYILSLPQKNHILTNAMLATRRNLEEECNKVIEPDRCSVETNNNRIIISYEDKLEIDGDSSMTTNKTAHLGLYRENVSPAAKGSASLPA